MEKAVRVDMLDFDFWTILFSVINILVLFFFLKKFLFGRVNAMLEKRAQMVQRIWTKPSSMPLMRKS